MKKQLLHIAISAFLVATFSACEEENLISGSTKSTNGTTTPIATPPTTTPPTTTPTGTKCYIKDESGVIDGDTYKSVYTFNAKNLLEKIDNNGAITSYTYDANSRISVVSLVDGNTKETFTYTYDAKGNIFNAKYDAKNSPFELLVKEFVFTTNASGQVVKILAVSSVSASENSEYVLDYDTKGNLKKLSVKDGTALETMIENLSFDDKTNVFANTGLSKVYLPIVIIGAFLGENFSYYINVNNILTDKSISFFSAEYATTTYKYEYAKEGQPTKKSYVTQAGVSKIIGNSTYAYTCK